MAATYSGWQVVGIVLLSLCTLFGYFAIVAAHMPVLGCPGNPVPLRLAGVVFALPGTLFLLASMLDGCGGP